MVKEPLFAPGLMTIDEAARFLRLSRAKTYQMAQRGELPSIRFGRSVRISHEALDAWIKANMEGDAA